MAACDRRAEDVATAVAGLGDDEVIAIALDVTSEQQWQAAVEKTVERFGRLTALVNNAGCCIAPRWPTRRSRVSKTLGASTVWAHSWVCVPRSGNCGKPSTRPS